MVEWQHLQINDGLVWELCQFSCYVSLVMVETL